MIELSSVSKTYSMGEAAVHALRDVSLKIERGEFVAIMGPSGSGKSTLMHTLGLLDRPDSGSYRLMNREVAGLGDDERAAFRSRNIGFIFQQFHLLSRTTAQANVAMPLLYSAGFADLARAEKALKEVGLESRMHHKPNELSGGQQQRVAIARALINDPEVILADEPTGNLDSASANDIMAVLVELNRRGKTVVLVTHEADIAQYARRVITMRDGVIHSDERKDSRGAPAAAPAERANVPASTWHAEFLRTWSLTQQAFRNLAANKVRSGLSMLGILIGVAAVIAMLALGTGAKDAIRKQLSGLGSNGLILRSGADRQRGVAGQAGAVARITLEDARALPGAVPSIARIAPEVSGRVQVIAGGKNWNTQVIGTTPAFAPMRSYVPQVGRFVTEDDLTRRLRVAVVGMTIVRELFGSANPIGQYIRLNRVNFQIVGVLPEKGADRWHDQDDVVFIPLTTAMYRLLGKDYVDTVSIEIANEDQIEDAQTQIKNVMARRHRITGDPDEAFRIHNLSEIQEMISSTSRTMSVLLSVIALISLIVGGIGIMNIMLVSVTERTREIGLRKAVGARSGDILLQFLTEAVVISLLGGLIGIALGWGAAFGMSTVLGWATTVSIGSVALASLFSAAIGIIFGLWPARKAAFLDPIEALRYE